MSIIQLSVSFEVEDEERPDLSTICSAVEYRLRNLNGVDEVFADVGGSTRKYAIVVELTGDQPDSNAASTEMVSAVKELVPRLVNEPRIGRAWQLEDEE